MRFIIFAIAFVVIAAAFASEDETFSEVDTMVPEKVEFQEAVRTKTVIPKEKSEFLQQSRKPGWRPAPSHHDFNQLLQAKSKAGLCTYFGTKTKVPSNKLGNVAHTKKLKNSLNKSHSCTFEKTVRPVYTYAGCHT